MQPLTRTPGFPQKAHTSRAGRTGGELYHCKRQAPKAPPLRVQRYDRPDGTFSGFCWRGM